MKYEHQETGVTIEISTSRPFETKRNLGPSWGFSDWATKEISDRITVQGPTDGVWIYTSDNDKEPL